jgi:hypothetical protein
MTKQKMRFSEAEISLIQATFKDDDALIDLRKHFLQVEDAKNFTSKEIKALIAKTFLPQIDPEAPLNQIVDFNLIAAVRDKDIDSAYQAVLVQKIVIDYFQDRINALGGDEKKTILFKELDTIHEDKEKTVLNFIARQSIVSLIESGLSQLNVLANQSMEDLLKQLEKNSTK